MTQFTRFTIGPAAVLVAIGCQSATRRSNFSRTPAAVRERFVGEYALARAGGPGACAAFRTLAREPRFPLPDLARLRALEACHDASETLDRASLPVYLRELGLDVALSLARDRGDAAAEVDALVETSRRKLPAIEKTALMRQAVTRAAALKDSKRLAELNARLYEIAPRLNPAPRPDQFLAVATDFRLAREFKPARSYFERAFARARSVEDKIAALRGLRTLAKTAREGDLHLTAARRLSAYLSRTGAAHHKSLKVRAAAYDALLFEARAVWTDGRRDAALKLITQLEREHRGRRSLAEAYWLRARIAEEIGDHAAVARELARAGRENPTGPLRDKIFWNAAWNERQRGSLEDAARWLRELEAGTTDDGVRPRALYWLGQTLVDQKQNDAAAPIFARVIELDPLGYYGLLAHRRLNRPLVVKSRASTTREIASTMDATLGDWLTALGETDLLATVVDDAAAAYARTPNQTEGAWLDLLETYARAGLYLKLFAGLGQLAPGVRRGVLNDHPGLLFPRPFTDLVGAAAGRFGVEDALIYSIMRQESAFDPKVRSSADAYGLMQLIPEVALRTSKTTGVRFTKGEDMFDPAVSISLGAAFLKELSDRHQGKLILLSAAYNASDSAIRGWVKARSHGDATAFIEEIPFEETRAYVRLVLRNLVFYRALTNPETPLPFPEDTLALP